MGYNQNKSFASKLDELPVRIIVRGIEFERQRLWNSYVYSIASYSNLEKPEEVIALASNK